MVSDKTASPRPIRTSIGRQVLDIITSGMYNDPLMVLREYIQNAADAIDELCLERGLSPDDCHIQIHVNGKDRTISVLDNGTGISTQCVEERLGTLGFSSKEGANRRGFRGIGRLGGLAYCDLLRFETRANSRQPISVVEWDNRKLHAIAQNTEGKHPLSETIRRIAKISVRRATKDDLKRFFKVTMVNVHRFHTDVLMNLKALKAYFSRTAPVPFHTDSKVFSFGIELDEFLSEIPNYKKYKISINGEQVYKPHTHEIRISSNQYDIINGIRKLTFTNPETGDMIGLGWFALTSFKSSFPKSVLMRGIGVRHGNIEVGDERFLDHIYSEKRFATWHIGEIHLNHSIKPNARRDGFEENYDYERFLERATIIGKGLSNLCRSSSEKRSARQRVAMELSRIENNTRLSNLTIDRKHQVTVIEKSIERLRLVSGLAAVHNLDDLAGKAKQIRKKIKKLQSKQRFLISQIDGRKVRHIPRKELLQRICSKVVDVHEENQSIERTLEKALEPYMKR